jgi:hypothetical protein
MVKPVSVRLFNRTAACGSAFCIFDRPRYAVSICGAGRAGISKSASGLIGR